MDVAYISALSALAGSAIGALSSLATTWLTLNTQTRSAYLNQQRTKREALYSEFIDEASRLFLDALSHEMEDLSKLVTLYSIVSKIGLSASEEVVTRATEVMDGDHRRLLQAKPQVHSRGRDHSSQRIRSFASIQRKLPCGIGRLITSHKILISRYNPPIQAVQNSWNFSF